MEGSAVAAMSGPAPTEQPAPVAAEPVLAEQPAPAAEPVAAVAAAPVAPVASPDDAAIVEAIRGIVATGDLNVLTVKVRRVVTSLGPHDAHVRPRVRGPLCVASSAVPADVR